MLEKIGAEIVELIRKKIVDEKIDVTGNLKNSVDFIINENKIEIIMAEYGKYVENGTKPHNINREGVEKIKIWAKSKNISPWGVITNIRLYGTKPHPFLSKIENTEIDNIIKKYYFEYVNNQSEVLFSELRKIFNK